MAKKKTVVLIVEDEIPIRDMLRFALPEEFLLEEAENTKEAEHLMAKRLPHILLLDWMLPGKSGIEFVKQLKQNKFTQDIPIIMLTARAEEENKIKALDLGADDYVTKPFSPQELIARVKTVLRRGPLIQPDGFLSYKTLAIHTHSAEVMIDDQVLPLTPIGYRLLHFFMTHPDKVYSREQLLQNIWTDSLEKNDRLVDVQIKALRKILAPYGYRNLIKTVRSQGYKCCYEK